MALSIAEAERLLALVNRPGMPAQWGYDPAKGLFYTVGYQGRPQYSATGPDGSVQAPKPSGGGGLIHGAMQWDNQEGQWRSPIDIGKVASWGVGAGLGVGALDAAGVFGAGAGAGTGSTVGLGPSTPANIAATSAAAHAVPASLAVGTGASAGAGAALTQILRSIATPRGAAGLAALLPVLTHGLGSGGSGGSGGTIPMPDLSQNPFADLAPPTDARDAYAMQKGRVTEAQPLYDALVAQAYGMTPTRYRGAAPEGLPASATAPVSGAYAYRGPQFG